MPLPVIPVAIALLGLGGYGVHQGVSAFNDNEEAKRLMAEAQRAFERARDELIASRAETVASLDALGLLKLEVWQRDLGDFVRHFQQLRNVDLRGAARVGALGPQAFAAGELAEMRQISVHAGEVLAGGTTALASGALAGVAGYGGAMMFASASTGTAIASLTGVAASNATLAWFGGGSLAAGGFGMAGGMAVLGGIVAAPVIAVGGIMLASQARANLDAAKAEHAKAMLAVEQMGAASDIVTAIANVTAQFHDTVNRLATRARREFGLLEKLITTRGTDYNGFTRPERDVVHGAVLFAQTLKALLETPILTPEGAVSRGHGRALAAASVLLGTSKDRR